MLVWSSGRGLSTIKHFLTQAPVLAFPNFLIRDLSWKLMPGLGAILTQNGMV